MKYYNAADNGFYDTGIHGNTVPKDAVKITDEKWHSLLADQASGHIIGPGKDGEPISYLPEIEAPRRRARDQLLSESDWLVLRHQDQTEAGEETTLPDAQYKALQEWRSALRKITDHPDWPKVQIPARPEGI